jgi:hypothetical protein
VQLLTAKAMSGRVPRAAKVTLLSSTLYGKVDTGALEGSLSMCNDNRRLGSACT